jgi:ubiquitin C-terminal hydrolase
MSEIFTIQCIEGAKGVGFWIDYIKHAMQCIEGTKEGGLMVLDKLHKTYNTMHRGTKGKWAATKELKYC